MSTRSKYLLLGIFIIIVGLGCFLPVLQGRSSGAFNYIGGGMGLIFGIGCIRAFINQR